MTQRSFLTTRVLPAVAAGMLALTVFTPTTADAQWAYDSTWGYAPYYAPPPVYYTPRAYTYGYAPGYYEFGPGYDHPFQYFGWSSQYPAHPHDGAS